MAFSLLCKQRKLVQKVSVVPRPRDADQGQWGVYLGFFCNAFLKLSWPVVELLELESQFTGSFLRGQDEMGCGRVTGRKGKTWYQLASEQNRETDFWTNGDSNSQSQSKEKKQIYFQYWLPLCTNDLCTLISEPGHSGVVCSSSAETGLSGNATLMRPKVNPYMASQLLNHEVLLAKCHCN